jgi:hypothetical protein
MLPNICSRYERMQCSRIKQHYCRSVVDEKHTNENIRSFLRFFHSNRNRVGSMGRGRCSCSGLISTSVLIGASVVKMSLFTTVVAPTIILLRVLDSLGPLNTLISSSRSLEIVGVLNHLMPRGRESLSNCMWPWLKLWLSRMEHRSS